MDTKTTLLDSAERMMRQRGYDAVSFGDLADEIGIRKASIHYHFPKKADLAVDLIDRYSARLAKMRSELRVSSGTAGEALAGLIEIYRDALDQGQQLCLCVAFSAGRDSLDTRTLTLLEKFHEESLKWLETVFTLAQQDGSIVDVTNPAQDAIGTLALLEGAQVMARAVGGLAPYIAATQTLTNRIKQ